MISIPEDRAGENTDVLDLITQLWEFRWLIILCTVATTALATMFAFMSQPVYRATATLISGSAERNSMSGSLNSALGSVGGLAALAGVSLQSSDSETEECLAVLKSRSFIEKFISDNNLLPELFPKLWDSSTKSWKVSPDKRPTLVRGYRLFDNIRTVTQIPKSGLITLQIEWPNREKTAVWANELVERVNAEMRGRAISEADESIAFLEKELASTTEVSTRDAVSRLVESQIKQRMVAEVTPEYALRVVDRAMASEPERPIRPKKALYISVGFILGAALGIAAALATAAIRRLKRQYRELRASRGVP
jgi:uncharacterized protein involved in exopolysaccharide biosynthesis